MSDLAFDNLAIQRNRLMQTSPVPPVSMVPSVYVCILNWNGWRDTLQCLESLANLGYGNFRVVVCDNGSEDDSCEQIAAWMAANGERFCRGPKRVSESLFAIAHSNDAQDLATGERVLFLLKNGSNLGFAEGNNHGIRFALAQRDCEFVWLLNNDTVVEPEALTALVERFRAEPLLGLCGSRLVFFHNRQIVQALGGGTYSPWFAIATHVGEGMTTSEADSCAIPAIDYPCAASTLVSRRFIEDVGLMSPDYFLYFEELDWVYRARGRFLVGSAPESIVFHKEGGSIGSDGKAAMRSALSDYFLTRSRFVFTKKFHAYALPTLFAWLLVMVAARILRHGIRDGWARGRLVIGAAIDGVSGRISRHTLPRAKAPDIFKMET